jgi:O-antigen ligase
MSYQAIPMHLKVDLKSIQNYALYIYFFSMVFESFNLFGLGSISFFSGILYVTAVAPSIINLVNLNKNIYYLWPIVIFTIYLSLISLVNINSFSSKVFDFQMILNICIFFIIINHVKKDNKVLEKAFCAFFYSAFFGSVLLILGIGTEISDEGLRPGRIMFYGSGPNELGIKLASALAVGAVFILQKKFGYSMIHKIFILLCLPIIFYAILQTGSRTAISVPFLALLIWLFARILVSKYKIIAILSGALILFIIAVPMVFFALQSEVLVTRFEQTGVGDFTSQNGRFFLWFGFLSLAQENLIFGNGLSGFEKITQDFFGFVESPHNVLLEVVLYSGLIGLFLYLIFLYRCFYTGYKLYRDSKELLPILLIPSVIAYIMFLQALSEKVVWLIFAYIISTYLYNSEKPNYKL